MAGLETPSPPGSEWGRKGVRQSKSWGVGYDTVTIRVRPCGRREWGKVGESVRQQEPHLASSLIKPMTVRGGSMPAGLRNVEMCMFMGIPAADDVHVIATLHNN